MVGLIDFCWGLRGFRVANWFGIQVIRVVRDMSLSSSFVYWLCILLGTCCKTTGQRDFRDSLITSGRLHGSSASRKI